MVKKWRKTKNIFFTSISPKTFHFDQKISYFYQQTKAGRDVELGEEYQTGPFKDLILIKLYMSLWSFKMQSGWV